MPILLASVPLLLLSLLSLRLKVFEPRYVLAAAPGFMLLIALYFARQRYRPPMLMRGLGVVAVVFWLGLSAVSLYDYYAVPEYAKSSDWPALLTYLKAYTSPSDIIVQAAADEAFNYTFDEFGMATDRKQLPANPAQSTEEITALLDADSRTHPSIWRVAQTFPDWPNYGVVENWLDAHMQLVRDVTISRLRARQYMPWDVAASEIAPDSLATFGDVAELDGTAILDDGDMSGQLTVLLYWRPLRQTATPLKVSVQLIGPTNPATGTPLWTQDDHEPQMGRVQTTTWTPDSLYRDVYTLPLVDVTPSTYSLIVRLYDPATGERLRVNGADGYTIGEITVGQ
jgi:hypothetical protein